MVASSLLECRIFKMTLSIHFNHCQGHALYANEHPTLLECMHTYIETLMEVSLY